MELSVYNAYCREEQLTEDQLISRISEITSWQTRIGKLFNLVECEKRSAWEVSAYRAFETYTCFLLDEAQQILQVKLATRLRELPIEQIEPVLKQWEDDPKFAAVYDRAKLTSRELTLSEILEERDVLAPYMEMQAFDAWSLDKTSAFWPVVTPKSLMAGGDPYQVSKFWLVETAESSIAGNDDAGDAQADCSCIASSVDLSAIKKKKQGPKPITEWPSFQRLILSKILGHAPVNGVPLYLSVARLISMTDLYLIDTYREAPLNDGSFKTLEDFLLLKSNILLREKFTNSVSGVQCALKDLNAFLAA